MQVRTSTVGSLLEHEECKIVNREGRTVPLGEEGEVCLRGFNVMKCYWNEPKKTAEVFLFLFFPIFIFNFNLNDFPLPFNLYVFCIIQN